MARRVTALACCGCRRPLRRSSGNVLHGESDAKSFGEAGELVRLPTMPKGDRDSDRLRIAADRQVAGTADELREEFLRVELVEQ